MAAPLPPEHVLAFLEDSLGAAAVLRSSHAIADRFGGKLTVLAVATLPEEPPGCCDLKSTLWRRLQMELAVEQVTSAREQLGAHSGVTFAVGEGPILAEVVAREAGARGCDLIVVPDERGPLRRWRRTLADRVRQRCESQVTTPAGLERTGPDESAP